MIDYNNIINNYLMININIINSFNVFLFIILAFIISYLIDRFYGELPAKIHPVVLIGLLIDFFKKLFINIKNIKSGILLLCCVYIVISVLFFLLFILCSFNQLLYFIVFTVLLSSTFSVKMLLQSAIDVKKDLDDNINKARESVSYLVSRNTEDLTESFIVSAVIESLTENITDSYVAPIFYYFVFAFIILTTSFPCQLYFLLLIPVIYRTSNTMDAMVGYKTNELKYIGFVPAKIDDILNYIPSRISGIYVIISACFLKLDWKNAFKIMIRDARNCPSPNSGYTMATTAGALNIQLIKKDTYVLGDNSKKIVKSDIEKAVKLSKLSIILFSMTVAILFILIYLII